MIIVLAIAGLAVIVGTIYLWRETPGDGGAAPSDSTKDRLIDSTPPSGSTGT